MEVESSLRASGLPPEALELEITEISRSEAWLVANDKKKAAIARANVVLWRMSAIPDHTGDVGALCGKSADRRASCLRTFPTIIIWTAYLLLQQASGPWCGS